MSAIGDYVHLYAIHYEQTGINKLNEGAGPIFSYAEEKARINQRMMSYPGQMSEGEKEILKSELAYIFSTQNIKDDSDVVAYQQMLESKMIESFGRKMGNINWETGNVAMTDLQSKRSQILEKLSTKKDIYISTIKKDWDTILANINEIESQMDKNQLQKILNNINSFIVSIEETTHTGIKELSGIDYKIDIQDLSTGDRKKLKSIVSDINKMIDILGTTPPINLEKGDLFEYAVAVAQAAALKKANEEVEQSMEQVVGKNRSNAQLNMRYFSKEFNLEATNINYSDAEGSKINLGFSPSQEKVDIQLEMGDGRIANVSAKNVNLLNNKNIHILNNSSLLYLLQGADADFVNHYLNMVAAHPDGSSWNIAKNIMAAREGVKMTILWEALSGDTYGRSKIADTFIVNNNAASGIDSIQIYDIATLAQEAMENIDAFTKITANGKDLDAITFANAREESSYSVRLSKLLEDVHAQKISVMLSSTLLS